jgi:hypothetical protein
MGLLLAEQRISWDNGRQPKYSGTSARELRIRTARVHCLPFRQFEILAQLAPELELKRNLLLEVLQKRRFFNPNRHPHVFARVEAKSLALKAADHSECIIAWFTTGR